MIDKPEKMVERMGSITENYAKTGMTIPLLIRVINAFVRNGFIDILKYRPFDNTFDIGCWDLLDVFELLGDDAKLIPRNRKNYTINESKAKELFRNNIPILFANIPDSYKTRIINVLYDELEEEAGTDITTSGKFSADKFLADPVTTLEKIKDEYSNNSGVRRKIDSTMRTMEGVFVSILEKEMVYDIIERSIEHVVTTTATWNINGYSIPVNFIIQEDIEDIESRIVVFLEFSEIIGVTLLANEADIVELGNYLEVITSPDSHNEIEKDSLIMPEFKIPELNQEVINKNIDKWPEFFFSRLYDHMTL